MTISITIAAGDRRNACRVPFLSVVNHQNQCLGIFPLKDCFGEACAVTAAVALEQAFRTANPELVSVTGNAALTRAVVAETLKRLPVLAA